MLLTRIMSAKLLINWIAWLEHGTVPWVHRTISMLRPGLNDRAKFHYLAELMPVCLSHRGLIRE